MLLTTYTSLARVQDASKEREHERTQAKLRLISTLTFILNFTGSWIIVDHMSCSLCCKGTCTL